MVRFSRRISSEEALDHRWLSVQDTMVRRRENIRFSSNRLRVFARKYQYKRASLATVNNQLLSTYGVGDS